MAALRNVGSASNARPRILPPKYSLFGHYHRMVQEEDDTYSCGCGPRFTTLADALEHLEETCVFGSVEELLEKESLEEQVAYINEHPNL